MLRSYDVQSGCILLFTMLHYRLTSVTKSERLLALEIFLSYDMCIWRKLFQFNFFLLLTNAILFFFCTYEGFYNFVSCTIFHPFFRYHFLKTTITHNVYCLNRSSHHQSVKTSLYHHSFIVKDIWSAACTLYIVVKQTKADQITHMRT